MERRALQTVDDAAWKKYKQLAAQHASEPAIAHQIQEALAKETDLLFARGTR